MSSDTSLSLPTNNNSLSHSNSTLQLAPVVILPKKTVRFQEHSTAEDATSPSASLKGKQPAMDLESLLRAEEDDDAELTRQEMEQLALQKAQEQQRELEIATEARKKAADVNVSASKTDAVLAEVQDLVSYEDVFSKAETEIAIPSSVVTIIENAESEDVAAEEEDSEEEEESSDQLVDAIAREMDSTIDSLDIELQRLYEFRAKIHASPKVFDQEDHHIIAAKIKNAEAAYKAHVDQCDAMKRLLKDRLMPIKTIIYTRAQVLASCESTFEHHPDLKAFFESKQQTLLDRYFASSSKFEERWERILQSYTNTKQQMLADVTSYSVVGDQAPSPLAPKISHKQAVRADSEALLLSRRSQTSTATPVQQQQQRSPQQATNPRQHDGGSLQPGARNGSGISPQPRHGVRS